MILRFLKAMFDVFFPSNTKYLYLIVFGHGRYIKLGITKDIERRVKELNRIYKRYGGVDYNKSVALKGPASSVNFLERMLKQRFNKQCPEIIKTGLNGCTEVRVIRHRERIVGIFNDYKTKGEFSEFFNLNYLKPVIKKTKNVRMS